MKFAMLVVEHTIPCTVVSTTTLMIHEDSRDYDYLNLLLRALHNSPTVKRAYIEINGKKYLPGIVVQVVPKMREEGEFGVHLQNVTEKDREFLAKYFERGADETGC